ncbi:hypothetical protein [uncultured Campylobacter sp.]|uniref:hypothetical protein n=1 Tax=uncultured Campylobacter sp. TaxID=218934 RepID=UPI002620DA82|nr:hypothetical protein [uncultured Campylobacter sp.]
MAKRAMSSEHASRVKLSGHQKEKIFANLIGLDDEYKHDRQAKKDVIDFNGDGHSVKSGTWWQIFLYSIKRIKDDYGFLAMNGMGQLILDCLEIFPQNRADYECEKQKYKDALKIPMIALCEKLKDKNRLKAFLSKAIFNGGEVQFLSVFPNDDSGDIYVFYYQDVIDVLAQNLNVENSRARMANQTDAQKVIFKHDVSVGEIEVRNDSDIHYKEIKFRLNSKKILDILKNDIKDRDKPKLINNVENTRIYRYGKAIKKFN